MGMGAGGPGGGGGAARGGQINFFSLSIADLQETKSSSRGF